MNTWSRLLVVRFLLNVFGLLSIYLYPNPSKSFYRSMELLCPFEKSILKSPMMMVCEHGSALMNWFSYLCSLLYILFFFSGYPYILMILRIFVPSLFVRLYMLICSVDLSVSFVNIISFLIRRICPADRYFSEFLCVAAV